MEAAPGTEGEVGFPFASTERPDPERKPGAELDRTGSVLSEAERGRAGAPDPAGAELGRAGAGGFPF